MVGTFVPLLVNLNQILTFVIIFRAFSQMLFLPVKSSISRMCSCVRCLEVEQKMLLQKFHTLSIRMHSEVVFYKSSLTKLCSSLSNVDF